MKATKVLFALSILGLLVIGGCGKKADTEPVVLESVETEVVEEVEAIEEIEPVEEVESTAPVEEEPVAEDVPLTQEELDTLKSQATTDDQKKALDAYETITKEGSWTSPNGVTYTEAVGKPDGSWSKMSKVEAEETLKTASPGEDKYYYAQAELKGKDYVEYDTVTGTVYYDPYKYAEAMKPVIQESIRISEVDEILSADEVPY